MYILNLTIVYKLYVVLLITFKARLVQVLPRILHSIPEGFRYLVRVLNYECIIVGMEYAFKVISLK